MNWDQISGNWKQIEGAVRENWGKFTDDDIAVIKGKHEQLVGVIQEKYGISKEEAQKQADSFQNTLKKLFNKKDLNN